MQRHHRHQDVPNTPRDASIRPTHPSPHVNVVSTPGPCRVLALTDASPRKTPVPSPSIFVTSLTLTHAPSNHHQEVTGTPVGTRVGLDAWALLAVVGRRAFVGEEDTVQG